MPAQYTAIRDKLVAQGKPLKEAKSRASAIFIGTAKGKRARSARAKLLRAG